LTAEGIGALKFIVNDGAAHGVDKHAVTLNLEPFIEKFSVPLFGPE
jgi:hypothetical protein